MIHVFAWNGDGSDMGQGWPGNYKGSVSSWDELAASDLSLAWEDFMFAVQEGDGGQLEVIGNAHREYDQAGQLSAIVWERDD